MSGEKRAGEENKTKAQGAQNNPENVSRPIRAAVPRAEKGKAERTNQATGNENRGEGERQDRGATSEQNRRPTADRPEELQTNRRAGAERTAGQSGQNAAPRASMSNPQKVRVEGNAI